MFARITFRILTFMFGKISYRIKILGRKTFNYSNGRGDTITISNVWKNNNQNFNIWKDNFRNFNAWKDDIKLI